MMTTLQSKKDAFAVPDSTDWLSTPLTSLSAVEASMRCQVCKDFYQTPMITSCAHTFCSVCIRRCLSTEGKCPACRSSDQELKLRFNAAMEEAVQAFVRGREAILDYARTEKQVVEVEKGGRKRRERDVDGASEDTPRKRTRASTRSQSQTQSQSSQAPRERAVIEDSEDDGDSLLAEGYTHCPICSSEVEISTINAHIDRNCVDPPPTKKPQKSTFHSPPQPLSKPIIKTLDRLPQVNYSMLKDVPLRKKLTDAGLSAAGSRLLLQQRYSEWITLWNANCDATRPKTKMELKREMDMWERTQGGRAMGSMAGAQIRDKDFDGKAWSQRHEGDFKNLIADAKRKVAKKAEEAKEREEKEGNNPLQPVSKDTESVAPLTTLESPTQHATESASNSMQVTPSLPTRASSQRTPYFQEKDGEEHDIHPPSSQQIIT